MVTNLVTSGNSFKILFGLIDIVKKMSMTRQERERFVLDLYNQGKNIREIAKEARISFRDIGVILNKGVEGREQQQEGNNDAADNKNLQQQKQEQQHLSTSTQAYKLFSEGKTPIEVAVALNLRESDVTKFYKEYWRLNHMHAQII
jgi:DNA-binding CsgD family transcriptional regulator